MASDFPPPSDSPDDAALELPPADIEALLAQAEQFVREAADELGDQFNAEAPSRPIDLSRPVSPAIVEEQLDEVAALVAQANIEASAWAAFVDDSPPANVDATTTADDAPSRPASIDVAAPAVRDEVPATRERPAIFAPGADADTATLGDAISKPETELTGQPPTPAATVAPATEPSSEASDSSAETEPLEHRDDSHEAPRADDAAPADHAPVEAEAPLLPLPGGPLAWPILLLLALNAPFRCVGPRGRRMAGLVAIATLLTSGIVWLLPFLL